MLDLLREGFTNNEIGRLLGISTRTAKAHVAAVIEKLMQQRDDKVDRVEYLQKKYKIRVKGEPDPEEDDDGDAGKQGVLA